MSVNMHKGWLRVNGEYLKLRAAKVCHFLPACFLPVVVVV